MKNGKVPKNFRVLKVGEVLKQGKDKKIKIFKYNAKKKYRKTQGHRQPYTKIENHTIRVVFCDCVNRLVTINIKNIKFKFMI